MKKNNNKDLIRKINSENLEESQAAINQLRISGKPEDLSKIVSLIKQTESERVKRKLLELMSDIKTESAIPTLVELIKIEKSNDIKANLIRVCWESNLDFSPYFMFFSKLSLESDYQSALEAFSVMENCLNEFHPKSEDVEDAVDLLKVSITRQTEEKKDLLHQLVVLLQEYLETIQ